MREILLVSISALLGYIIFSAFSTTSTLEEGFRKVIEQPKDNPELAFNRLDNEKEATMIRLDNEHKKEELNTYENIKINEKENNTKVELKEIDYRTSSALANMKLQSEIVQQKQNNYTYIVIAFLLFLLVIIYLRYQKHLTQMELNQENEYKELLAKKEYAEKILTLLAAGNLTFETERKLLKVLDELNGHKIEEEQDRDIIYHPNPEIAHLKR